MSVRDALRRAPMVNDVPGLRLLKVGDGWDVVRISAQTGLLALAYLRGTGTSVGPVLYDRPNERLYYAIPTGTAASWDDLPDGTSPPTPGSSHQAWSCSTTGSAAGASCPTTTPSPTRTPSAPRSNTHTSRLPRK